MNIIYIIPIVGILLIAVVMYPFLKPAEKWYKIEIDGRFKVLSTKKRFIDLAGNISKSGKPLLMTSKDADRMLKSLNSNEL